MSTIRFQQKVIILSAPSGCGKTTLGKELMQRVSNLAFSVSACTRTPRLEEKNGRDYYFLSSKDFREKIQKKEFLEWEEVYKNHLYGTLHKEIERLNQLEKHVLFDVDVQGGKNLKRHFTKYALSVFIEPPSVAALAERLRLRGTENSKSFEERLSIATQELEECLHFDYRLINDSLDQATEKLCEIVEAFLQ